jgi:hypothetical protein
MSVNVFAAVRIWFAVCSVLTTGGLVGAYQLLKEHILPF